MRLFKIIFGLFLAGLPAFAQTTTVTAIVTDSDSFVWTKAQVTMTFVPNPSFPNYNQYTLNGQNLATYQPYNSLLTQTVQTNANTGSFTLTGLDNTQIKPQGSSWSFTIKSNTTAPATVYQNFQLQGSSMNLTNFLSSNSVAPRFPAQPGVYGYGDVELTTVPFPGGQYFNTTTLVPRFWNGIVWNNYGSGAATGVTSINSATGPATFTGAVTCTGTTSISCVFTGGGSASFNLNLAELGALSTGAILTHTGHYSVPQNQTLSQINTLLASAPDAAFDFQGIANNCYLSNNCDTSAYAPFTNSSLRAHITHQGHYFVTNTINVDEFGVIADARQMFMTFTAGSNVITPSANALSNLDVGKVIWCWNTSTNKAWETQVTSQNGSTFTVNSNAPWTQSSPNRFWIGTDNTTNLQAAFTYMGQNNNFQGVGYSAPALLTISAGSIMSHAINMTGASWRGAGSLTKFVGAPGEDSFYIPDAYTAGSITQGGVHIDDGSIAIGDGVNAIFPWTLYDDTGTHAKAALYRPSYVMTRASNFELAPEWCKGASFNNSGCQASVGTTNGTTLLCLSNLLQTYQLPAVGTFLAFPYTSSGLIVTTVASTSGSCAGGFTARTLGATIPTATQAEFYMTTVSGGLQNTAIDFPASPTYPFSLLLTNPNIPTPASEVGFAPYGVVEIGNQICTYYGGGFNPPAINIQSCTGTSVDHPSTSVVVAMNPFIPSMPMPVIPSINNGDTTPTNASWFPGQNVGACAFSFSQSNGSTGQALAWSNSVVENLFISNQAIPSYQNTCEFYFVGNPYATHFQNIRSTGTHFGIVYGVPSIQNHNWILHQPTSDSSSWNNISINAGYPLEVNDANQNSFANIDVYSNLASPSGAYVGCATGYYFTLQWDDQTGATGGASLTDNHNLYVEPETGTHCGQEFLNEFDGNNNTYTDIHQGGGGFNAIGGFDNHWIGGNLNNDSGGFGNVAPIINWGNGTSFLWTEGIGSAPFCNVFNYGPVTYNCTFINWGPKTHILARSDRTGPYGNVSYGNNRTAFDGQTMETWRDGKIGSDFYVHSGTGYIDPSEFDGRNFDSASVTTTWIFDPTAFISQSLVACNIGTNVGQSYCEPSVFNHNHIGIGPGQRLAAGKYLVYISAKSLNQTSNPVAFGIGHIVLSTGVRSPITGPINTTITPSYPTTNAGTWQAVVDLSAYGNNPATDGIAIEFYAATGTVTDNVAIQYVAFTPLPDNLSTQQLTIQGVGTPTLTTANGSEIWSTGVPTNSQCGTTYPNSSIWHNSAGNHGAVTLSYVCNAASTTWVGVF